jgi:hypothetical protein
VPAKAVPTPIYVFVSPAPTDTPVETPAPSDTPSPTDSPTLGPTPVVVGGAGTPTGPGASPGASPSATSATTGTAAPASVCTGTASNKAFWAQVARQFRWDVYCAVLPAGWGVKTGSYNSASPGDVTVTYGGPGGATLQLKEGAFCTLGADKCAPLTAPLGSAYFGDLAGTLDAASGGFAVHVNPGTTLAYSVTSSGLSQENFVAIASALVKVAK